MTSNDMVKRTKQFAIDCGYLILTLEQNVINRAYSSQLIRSRVLLGQTIGLHEEQNQTLISLINSK